MSNLTTMTPAQAKAIAQIRTTGTIEGISKRTLNALVRNGLALHYASGDYGITEFGAAAAARLSA